MFEELEGGVALRDLIEEIERGPKPIAGVATSTAGRCDQSSRRTHGDHALIGARSTILEP